MIFFVNQKARMRGGKRKGAGRKGAGPSKAYWLPIALEEKIKGLLNEYRAELNEKQTFEKQKESKDSVKLDISPILNKEQLKRFQKWLVSCKFAKSMTEARKLTETPDKCHKTFIKYIHLTEDYDVLKINDIIELYAID